MADEGLMPANPKQLLDAHVLRGCSHQLRVHLVGYIPALPMAFMSCGAHGGTGVISAPPWPTLGLCVLGLARTTQSESSLRLRGYAGHS